MLFTVSSPFSPEKYAFNPETGRVHPKQRLDGTSSLPKINNKGYLLGTYLFFISVCYTETCHWISCSSALLTTKGGGDLLHACVFLTNYLLSDTCFLLIFILFFHSHITLAESILVLTIYDVDGKWCRFWSDMTNINKL